MAFEDLGVLRSIVGLRLFEPTDNVMVKALIPLLASQYAWTTFACHAAAW
jgi:transketolase C-terminal domain/subunit